MNAKIAMVPLLFLLAGPKSALAHHSVSVNFDQSQEITIEGELTEISWRNPHSHIRIEVMDDHGATVQWLVEMGAVNTMRRIGFEMERFVVAKPISITGWPGRRDRSMYLLEVTLDDGTRLVCAGASCSQDR